MSEYTVEKLDVILEGLEDEDRLEKLKDICDAEDIHFHHKSGEAKLKELIIAHFQAKSAESDVEQAGKELSESGEELELQFKSLDRYPDETDTAYKARKRKEAHKLIRVRITCMNPSKSEYDTEIFTFGNDVVGTIRRAIPFNVETHVECVFLDMLRERKFQQFKMKKEKGIEVREGYLVNEFAIEILPPLTKEELAQLAHTQRARVG